MKPHFTSLDQAIDTAINADPQSEVFQAAAVYIFLHAPPELKAEIRQIFQACFPSLKPIGYADNGAALYDRADLANAFGLTEQEVIEHEAEAAALCRMLSGEATH